MTYFNRGGGFNNGGSDRSRFNDRGSDRPMMHSTTCDQCGKTCEVPFRPSGSKPVFCSNCFEAKGGNGSSDRGFGRSNDRYSSRGSDRVGVVRFDRNNDREYSNSSSYSKPASHSDDFAVLNKKIDKVMEMLYAIKQSVSPSESSAIEETKDDVKALKKEITKKIKKSIKENLEK